MEVLEIGPSMQPGIQWHLRMADFDADDLYRIRLLPGSAEGPLGIEWGWGSKEGEEQGPLEVLGSARFTAEALERGDGVLFLSQSSPEARDDDPRSPYRRHTPPFLVARSVRTALEDGDPVRLTVYGQNCEIEKAGEETRTLTIDGVAHPVRVLHATSDDIEAWILDHPEWPILLELAFQGENAIEVLRVETATG